MANPDDIQEDVSSECSESQHTLAHLTKHMVGSYTTYVLDSDINSLENSLLAIVLSNYCIKLYEDFNFDSPVTLTGHEKQVSGVKFSKQNPSILFSSALDGYVHTWDTRCGGSPVQSFSDTSDDNLKPISGFDIDVEEKVVCTGTEMIRESAFLIFWDRRMATNIGAYWELHTDDITQVCFHPSKKSEMVSGSVDGLINIFDINGQIEDDALQKTLNTESSVSKLRYKTGSYSKDKTDYISCFTHMEEYQLWSCDEASPLISYDRKKFSDKTKVHVDYFIDSFMLDDDVCVANGTKGGNIFLWLMRKDPVKFSTLKNGHKDVVRTLSWSDNKKVLVTGAEDGSVSVWKYGLEIW